MTNPPQTDELEIRRISQELAVAWRKGRAGFVLDSLDGEEPLRAALIATLVDETLTRWEPYDSRWPDRFRHALLLRSQGAVTPYEVAELEHEYRRSFGSTPPPPPTGGTAERTQTETVCLHVKRIRAALSSGRPLVRERAASSPPKFLRHRPARPAQTVQPQAPR